VAQASIMNYDKQVQLRRYSHTGSFSFPTPCFYCSDRNALLSISHAAASPDPRGCLVGGRNRANMGHEGPGPESGQTQRRIAVAVSECNGPSWNASHFPFCVVVSNQKYSVLVAENGRLGAVETLEMEVDARIAGPQELILINANSTAYVHQDVFSAYINILLRWGPMKSPTSWQPSVWRMLLTAWQLLTTE
jgi:hypothetical protein